MQDYLKFELAPFPLSLFDECGMRKTAEPAFADNFEVLQVPPSLKDGINVIDGGYLLYAVKWNQNEMIDNDLARYVGFVRNHFSADTIIVFDGYPENPTYSSTKSAERLRRSMKAVGTEYIIQRGMTIQTSQDKFSSNDKNKVRLISMLQEELRHTRFSTVQAQEDAEVLIVITAIDNSGGVSPVFVIDEDTDLLVLLTQFAHQKINLPFRKPDKGKNPY